MPAPQPQHIVADRTVVVFPLAGQLQFSAKWKTVVWASCVYWSPVTLLVMNSLTSSVISLGLPCAGEFMRVLIKPSSQVRWSPHGRKGKKYYHSLMHLCCQTVSRNVGCFFFYIFQFFPPPEFHPTWRHHRESQGVYYQHQDLIPIPLPGNPRGMLHFCFCVLSFSSSCSNCLKSIHS